MCAVESLKSNHWPFLLFSSDFVRISSHCQYWLSRDFEFQTLQDTCKLFDSDVRYGTQHAWPRVRVARVLMSLSEGNETRIPSHHASFSDWTALSCWLKFFLNWGKSMFGLVLCPRCSRKWAWPYSTRSRNAWAALSMNQHKRPGRSSTTKFLKTCWSPWSNNLLVSYYT